MLTYQPSSAGATLRFRSVINGRRWWDYLTRLYLGVDLVDGVIDLHRPPVHLAAALLHVEPKDLRKALAARRAAPDPAGLFGPEPNWFDVGNGHASNGNGHNGNGHGDAPQLVDLITSATAEEFAEAARAIGVAKIWDRMIVPNV